MQKITKVIPELDRLLEMVDMTSTNLHSTDHGPDHWRKVGMCGYMIAKHTDGVDPAVCFLFALFHDSMRENDYTDPHHGSRGAGLAGLAYSEELIHPSATQLNQLQEACRDHTDVTHHDDITIGACWDADRLQLPRVGIKTDPQYLNTAYAEKPGIIEWAESLAYLDPKDAPTWQELYEAYSSL